MSKATLLYSVIGLIIFATILNKLYLSAPLKKEQTSELPFQSDYFIQNVTIKYFDENGHLENKLNATKLEHFKPSQTSLITNPIMEIKNKKQSDWHVVATNGILDHAKNQITLNDSVEIKQSSKQNNRQLSADGESVKNETLVKTQNLKFDLNKNMAQTQNKVLIEINSLSTVANSMSIDFNLAKVDLEGQIQTTGQLND